MRRIAVREILKHLEEIRMRRRIRRDHVLDCIVFDQDVVTSRR